MVMMWNPDSKMFDRNIGKEFKYKSYSKGFQVSKEYYEDNEIWWDYLNNWKPIPLSRKVSMKKRIYLSGPMRGIKDYNFPLFYKAAALLEMWGYTVINPAKMDIDEGRAEWNWNERKIIVDNTFTIQDALKRDFKVILGCDAVVLLPGWEESEGAQKELEIALTIGLPAFAYDGEPINIQRDKPMEFEE